MDQFLTFFGDHPILGCIMLWVVWGIIAMPFRLLNRYFRTRNIKNAGWPPAHLDADGDVIKKDAA